MRTRRSWRIGACLLIGIVACGGGSGGGAGGGGSGGGASLAALEVNPPTATVTVGGTATYSAIARNGAGAVMATPPLVWTSGGAAIGSVSSAGLATGLSVGQTTITASAGGVVSPPAAFIVVAPVGPVAGPCDDIEKVAQWDVKLRYFYDDQITTSDKAVVSVQHFVSVAATLSPAGPLFGKPQWTGALTGTLLPDGSGPISLDERLDNVITADPTVVARIEAEGPVLPTDGVDGFTLTVDLATCSYQFTLAATVRATITKTEHAVKTLPGPDEGTTVTTQNLALGLLQKGRSAPLGGWRAAGMGDYSNYKSFDSYSVVYPPTDADAYIPAGFLAQAAFFYPPTPAPRGTGNGINIGRADVYFNISPHP